MKNPKKGEWVSHKRGMSADRGQITEVVDDNTIMVSMHYQDETTKPSPCDRRDYRRAPFPKTMRG